MAKCEILIMYDNSNEEMTILMTSDNDNDNNIMKWQWTMIVRIMK